MTEQQAGNRERPQLVQRGLPSEVKRRIVILFAQFQRVNDIHRTIVAEFGMDLDLRTIAHYDPDRPQARIGQGLRKLHASAREAWCGETAKIGISFQGQRLRLIEKAIEGAERSKDWGNVAKLIELAAKERGGVLTNVSKVEHGGAVAQVHMTADEARNELAARLRGVLDGGTLTPAKSLEHKDNP